MLSKLAKVESVTPLVHLFETASHPDEVAPVKETGEEAEKPWLNKKQDEQTVKSEDKPEEVHDLLTILPENFSEIPYIHSINIKKKSMEAFNSDLLKICSRKKF